MAELAFTREHGYARSNGEYYETAHAISASRTLGVLPPFYRMAPPSALNSD
ncbi:transcriptional regulator [Bordetella pertussis]|nr:transcriptional regulator [Bordetella pertussis]